jgi:hypothetical protein
MNLRRIVWDREQAHHRFLQLNPQDSDFEQINDHLRQIASSPNPIGKKVEPETHNPTEGSAWVTNVGKWRIVYELLHDKVNVLFVDDKMPGAT